MIFRADLHTHSSCSDGTFSPTRLLDHAKEKGLSGLSITDHDTSRAYTPELFAHAKSIGLKLLTGVEFSCVHLGFNVHILGYNYLIDDPGFLAFCERHCLRRKERNLAILEKLKKLGMIISEEELFRLAEGVVGRPHIASLLVKKRYVDSIQEAFNRYIGDKKCCYVKGESFSTLDSIEIIHKAGGKAFIAHPHLIEKKGLLKELLKLPFDGIECYYGLFSPNQERRWLELTQEKNLLISGGSDFHGEVKPHIPLGCSWVDEETFRKIACPIK